MAFYTRIKQTPIIQRVSHRDFALGNHYRSENKNGVVLIQIVDPCIEFPKPLHHFTEIHQFEFTDVECPSNITWEFRMSVAQANQIVEILCNAHKKKMDVIVHCNKGVSRSGAVVAMATYMGFKPLNEPSHFTNKYMLGLLKSCYVYRVKRQAFSGVRSQTPEPEPHL